MKCVLAAVLFCLAATQCWAQTTASPLRGSQSAEPIAPPSRPPPISKSPFAVQIGAFQSAAIGRERWAQLRKTYGDAARGKAISISRVTVGGRKLYRTRMVGFRTRASAQAFCQRLKAKAMDCFVTVGSD